MMTARQKKQTQQLCRDFLQYKKKGVVVEPIMASQMMNDDWGVYVDWHEMSEALEFLAECSQATRTGTTIERLTAYLIK